MNPILQSLCDRKSVRVYEPKQISPEAKREILLAAMQAPTAGNQQMYTILDITDEDLKRKLSVTCDNQPFIASAPLALVFVADPLKWVDAYRSVGCSPRAIGPGDLMLSMQDAVIAAQNAVTAAWSLGIGSCYIGDIMENAERHRELLHLPPQVMPATMVVFGYPTAQQAKRPKPERSPLHTMVYENTYRRRDAEELRRMIEPHVGQTPYEEWVAAFCKRKFDSDFAVELNRSAREYLKAFPPGKAE
jgi:FMN reductase (NADPH)